MKIPKKYTGYKFKRKLLNKILKYAYPPTYNARNAIGYSFSITLENDIYNWVGEWDFDTHDIKEDFFLDFKDFVVYYIESGEAVARGGLK